VQRFHQAAATSKARILDIRQARTETLPLWAGHTGVSFAIAIEGRYSNIMSFLTEVQSAWPIGQVRTFELSEDPRAPAVPSSR
jgi:hypothetical protein